MGPRNNFFFVIRELSIFSASSSWYFPIANYNKYLRSSVLALTRLNNIMKVQTILVSYYHFS